MNQTLLLIDIQNDYFPGGAMELAGGLEAGQAAANLADGFRRHGLSVIHIQHIATRPGATFFLPETDGVDFHVSVAPQAGELVVIKHFPSAFRQTGLLEHLRRRQVTRLVIAGMMTHMCIDTTVRAAADLGFNCVLAHDACATRDLSFGGVTVAAAQVQAAYMAALDGPFAKVSSAETIRDGLSLPRRRP